MAAAQPKVRPRKALGQHFLTNGKVLGRIVSAAGLAPDDVVVEIGPGSGNLTRRLLQAAGQVVAVEVDPGLAASLAPRLGNPSSLTTVQADARSVPLETLVAPGTPYKIVANLPYYAANPIVRRFLEAAYKPTLMVLTLQQEVAQDMVARPGRMKLLSVAVQLFAEARLVCTVPATAFSPPPKVTSAVVRLDLRSDTLVPGQEIDSFFSLVRAGFSAPRKQIRNSLAHGLGETGAAVDLLLDGAHVDGSRRPATLSLEEWAELHWVSISLSTEREVRNAETVGVGPSYN